MTFVIDFIDIQLLEADCISSQLKFKPADSFLGHVEFNQGRFITSLKWLMLWFMPLVTH